jgi:hypothetical protein
VIFQQGVLQQFVIDILGIFFAGVEIIYHLHKGINFGSSQLERYLL